MANLNIAIPRNSLCRRRSSAFRTCGTTLHVRLEMSRSRRCSARRLSADFSRTKAIRRSTRRGRDQAQIGRWSLRRPVYLLLEAERELEDAFLNTDERRAYPEQAERTRRPLQLRRGHGRVPSCGRSSSWCERRTGARSRCTRDLVLRRRVVSEIVCRRPMGSSSTTSPWHGSLTAAPPDPHKASCTTLPHPPPLPSA